MDRVKKERNAKKELLRLKKTLGLLDEHGNELIQKMDEVIEYKTPAQLKKVSASFRFFLSINCLTGRCILSGLRMEYFIEARFG